MYNNVLYVFVYYIGIPIFISHFELKQFTVEQCEYNMFAVS